MDPASSSRARSMALRVLWADAREQGLPEDLHRGDH